MARCLVRLDHSNGTISAPVRYATLCELALCIWLGYANTVAWAVELGGNPNGDHGDTVEGGSMATALQLRCDETGQFRRVWCTFAFKSHETGPSQLHRKDVATETPSTVPSWSPCAFPLLQAFEHGLLSTAWALELKLQCSYKCR
jgi:hypothetical protein